MILTLIVFNLISCVLGTNKHNVLLPDDITMQSCIRYTLHMHTNLTVS